MGGGGSNKTFTKISSNIRTPITTPLMITNGTNQLRQSGTIQPKKSIVNVELVKKPNNSIVKIPNSNVKLLKPLSIETATSEQTYTNKGPVKNTHKTITPLRLTNGTMPPNKPNIFNTNFTTKR